MHDSKKLGERIARARGLRGVTADELANILKIDSGGTYIGRYERGERVPQLWTFIDICNELKVSSDWLLADYLSIYEGISSSNIKQETKDLIDLLPDEATEVVNVASKILLRNYKKILEIE